MALTTPRFDQYLRRARAERPLKLLDRNYEYRIVPGNGSAECELDAAQSLLFVSEPFAGAEKFSNWNHYNWPQLLELIETEAFATANTKDFYYARNLFCVSISRPMKRLAVLATQTLSVTALTTATKLFGEANVVAVETAE